MLDPADEPTKDPRIFHLQADVPVVQSLDGPQLQRRWVA